MRCWDKPPQQPALCLLVIKALNDSGTMKYREDRLQQQPYLQAFRDDDAGCGEHGPPGMNELVRTVLLNLGRVLAKSERVVPVAACGIRGH